MLVQSLLYNIAVNLLCVVYAWGSDIYYAGVGMQLHSGRAWNANCARIESLRYTDLGSSLTD